jgi:hypothetical protein
LRSALGNGPPPVAPKGTKAEAGVQTVPMSAGGFEQDPFVGLEKSPSYSRQDSDDFQLSSTDLTSILRWSKEISSDINLSSGK